MVITASYQYQTAMSCMSLCLRVFLVSSWHNSANEIPYSKPKSTWTAQFISIRISGGAFKIVTNSFYKKHFLLKKAKEKLLKKLVVLIVLSKVHYTNRCK